MGRTYKNIENLEIMDYMKDLKSSIWEYLFTDLLAHDSIFHSLSELEQVIVCRLLFIQQLVSERAMRLWVNPNCLKKLSNSIKNLVETKILIGGETKKDNYNQYKINEIFRSTLLKKIYKDGDHRVSIFNNNIKHQMEMEQELFQQNLFPMKEELFSYAQGRWNHLLHIIASPQIARANMQMSKETSKPEIRGQKRMTNGNNQCPVKYEEDDHSLLNGKLEQAEEEEEENEEAEENEEEEEEEEEDIQEEKEITQGSKEFYRNTKCIQHHKKKNPDEEYQIEPYETMYNDEQWSDSTSKTKKKKRISRKKKKNTNSYDANIYYESLKNREMELGPNEKDLKDYNNNENSFINHTNTYVSVGSDKNKNAHVNTSLNESVIEVLKRKNFILNEKGKNKAKVISMSREAFSWFLKDLRSRIISLVVEYLLIIDDGYVTNVAKEASMKYQKKLHREKEETNGKKTNNNNNKEEEYQSPNMSKDLSAIGTDYTIDEDTPYITRKKKNTKESEQYVKETLLLILSIIQCNICQPIFLKHLTKAQLDFVDFGKDIGLFYKPNESCIFITPYAILLTMNNQNIQYCMTLFSNITIEGLGDNKWKDQLNEKYFHSYLLQQEEKLKIKNEDNKVTMGMIKEESEKIKSIVDKTDCDNIQMMIRQNIDYEKKLGDSDNYEIGLIVQSNFKVYMYTSSLLKINILSHLCELQARMPNMVVGVLTRNSVLNAFNSGITASQIIKFLESYSHPYNNKNNMNNNSNNNNMYSKSPIPQNVIAQLKLWESERFRLTFEDAIVFKSWDKEYLPQLYEQIVIWAKNKNYLLYYTPWPKLNTKEFEAWMKAEKYLCCIYESKNEVIEKIKEVREMLMKKK